jgi:hypothetical protein
MATIKSSFTNIQQSKKLAEILPIESADMCYVIDYAESNKYGTDHFKLEVDTYGLKVRTRDNIPCWTLGALLSVVAYYPTLHRTISGWRCDIYNEKGHISQFGEKSDNPIDACYEMILKLNELNLL